MRNHTLMQTIALISPDPLRRDFLGHERLVSTLYGAVKPDLAALEFAGRVACLAAIAEAIRTKLNPNLADSPLRSTPPAPPGRGTGRRQMASLKISVG